MPHYIIIHKEEIIQNYKVFFQGTKKFRSNSPGLLDFVVRLVEFTLYLPDSQVKVFGEIFLKLINRSTVEHCKFLG